MCEHQRLQVPTSQSCVLGIRPGSASCDVTNPARRPRLFESDFQGAWRELTLAAASVKTAVSCQLHQSSNTDPEEPEENRTCVWRGTLRNLVTSCSLSPPLCTCKNLSVSDLKLVWLMLTTPELLSRWRQKVWGVWTVQNIGCDWQKWCEQIHVRDRWMSNDNDEDERWN